MKNKKLIFLPYTYKAVGFILILIGIVWWFIAQHFNIVIRIPIFAIISSFVSTHFFSIIQTNFTDEISLMVLLLGSVFILFSKEKQETEETNTIRYNSIFTALLVNQLLLIFSVIFLYGAAFIFIILANLISFSVIYLIIMQIKIQKLKPKNLS